MMIKDDLRGYLQQSRDRVLGSLADLDEFSVRRPLTPTGTNLLGVVKHLAGVEYGYLGECVGRPPARPLPWYADGSVWDGADMWARAEESRAEIVGHYRAATAHADASLDALALDAPATVPWWDEGRRETTFGHLLVRTITDTAQHAGHCDILRETLIPTSGRDPSYGDDAYWDDYVAGIQAAADRHR